MPRPRRKPSASYPRTIAKHLKIILSKIGVEDVTVHDLRHTYATLAHGGIDFKVFFRQYFDNFDFSKVSAA